jgi:thermostable 8-oxoguanine DNA glycosylase
MRIIWQIDPEDVVKVKAFYSENQDNTLVQERIRRNMRADKSPVTKCQFWEELVGCLLTSQQRSGPNSRVSRFLSVSPFPLGYDICLAQQDLASFSRAVLGGFGGLLYYNNISKYLSKNLTFLGEGDWETICEHLEGVRVNSSPESERRAAQYLDDKLWGFGPKQARNLLQGLGLSRFETPIDSRITKWLNKFGFPVRLTAEPLQDPSYYNFISDGFQRLAEACAIMPCILDAAIFASFDGEGWKGPMP